MAGTIQAVTGHRTLFNRRNRAERVDEERSPRDRTHQVERTEQGESERVSTTQVHPSASALLTPAEVAAAFRVDPKTVTRWAKAGKLSFIRTLGGHRRYLEAEVLAKLASWSVPEDEPLWLAHGSPGEGT
jgi:excisionase family DNA binding protein